jgi:hypothetical protein
MEDDFVIDNISVLTGKYIFNNGRTHRSLDQITKEQITDYIKYLLDQIKQSSAAIIAKDEIR